MQHVDVLIVGGGPAGSACAWRLEQAGVQGLILEKQTFPRAKPCAGWITPQVLRDLQFSPADYPHSFTTFNKLHIRLRGVPLLLPGKQHAVRRIEFDHWLLERSGAQRETHEVREIAEAKGLYVVDSMYSAPYLVGAGGTHCPVYHTFFKAEYPRQPGARIVALEEEFSYDWGDPRCQLWFFENGLPGYAWYVPKSGGVVNLGVGGVEEGLRDKGMSIREHWDALVQKVAQKGLVTNRSFHPQGHVYYTRRGQTEVRRGNAFLVGDALGLATLDMGEGIGPAVRSGILAAEAILSGGEYAVEEIGELSFLPGVLGKYLD